MFFRNNLYFIDDIKRTDEGSIYTLHLNPGHIIYKAHSPGVCIMQIGVELIADTVGSNVDIKTVKNVKFLSILRPNCLTLSVEIHRIIIDGLNVNAHVVFSSTGVIIAKISLICQKTAK